MLTIVRRAVLVVLACAAMATMPSLALAASPTPVVLPGGDPRSSGEGAGFVGDPGMAIGLVLGIGVAAAVITYVYVRLTNPRTPP